MPVGWQWQGLLHVDCVLPGGATDVVALPAEVEAFFLLLLTVVCGPCFTATEEDADDTGFVNLHHCLVGVNNLASFEAHFGACPPYKKTFTLSSREKQLVTVD